MLDWGLELSLPIERKTIAGKEVFYVAGNSLVACFDDLTFDVVDEVAKDHPLRFVSAEKPFILTMIKPISKNALNSSLLIPKSSFFKRVK
jgi:hypothetical protein